MILHWGRGPAVSMTYGKLVVLYGTFCYRMTFMVTFISYMLPYNTI